MNGLLSVQNGKVSVRAAMPNREKVKEGEKTDI